MSDFAARYLSGDAALRDFFAHGPDDWPAAAAKLPAWNEALRAGLLRAQAELGLTREIPAGSLAIVTGQQPGLLTGPLYTVYKAITAIQLAERASAALGRPVVPIFWVAADDHDFEEVRTAHVLTQDHADLALRYEPTADVSGRAMFRVPLEPSLHALIDQAADAAPGSEFAAEIRAFLHESLDASTSFSGWFARLLARLFRDTPLLIFTTDLPEARRVAAPLFAHEIRHPLETTRRVNAAGSALSALGFPPQVVKAEDECAFFLEVDQHRRKVLRRDGLFHLPEEGLSLDAAALLDRLAAAPELFSANVALRPVVQQVLFPTLAYIGGPGELAYWAQFKGVFEHHGQPMPIVRARAQAVLTTIKLNKLLTRFGFTPAELTAPREALHERALAAAVKSPALDAFRREQPRAAEAVNALLHATAAADKRAKPAADAAEAHLSQAIAHLERALLRMDKAQTETVQKQVDRLATALAPQRLPQERVYSIFSFLFEHGWDLVPRLCAALDSERPGLQEIEL